MATDPLLAPLPEADWDDELPVVRGAGGEPLNIFGTLAHHPKLMKRWLVFGNHVLAKSTLPPRDRELRDLAIHLLGSDNPPDSRDLLLRPGYTAFLTNLKGYNPAKLLPPWS